MAATPVNDTDRTFVLEALFAVEDGEGDGVEFDGESHYGESTIRMSIWDEGLQVDRNFILTVREEV